MNKVTILDKIEQDMKEQELTTVTEMMAYLKMVVEHGCISGCVPSMIYYDDTQAFWTEHKEELNILLNEHITEMGVDSIQALFGNKIDHTDPLFLEAHNQNLMAWFGYEATAMEQLNKLEEKLGREVK